jgi:hypothetical protein
VRGRGRQGRKIRGRSPGFGHPPTLGQADPIILDAGLFSPTLVLHSRSFLPFDTDIEAQNRYATLQAPFNHDI